MGIRRGFSLLEVVIVVAIIAILAAIGIPRMSRGSAGAADAALVADLTILRNAIDLYAAEHSGRFPTVDGVADQLTQYTDISGEAQASKDTTHYYGPYLRSIPPAPVGINKGSTGINDIGGDDIGWVYNENTGSIRVYANVLDKDDSGKRYINY